MAQRVLKIRDKELYKEDGYTDFTSFIEGELTASKRTVYDHINIIECFGVRALAIEDKIAYSKLIPFIPLIKTNNENVPKEEIKKSILKEIKIKSYRDMQGEAKELKVKYGLTKEKKELSLVDKIKIDLEKLTKNEKTEIINYLKQHV